MWRIGIPVVALVVTLLAFRCVRQPASRPLRSNLIIAVLVFAIYMT